MKRSLFNELMYGLDALAEMRKGEKSMDILRQYESVEKFNDIAGNFDNVDVAAIEAQIKVVVEEINEMKDAFYNKDAVGLLDGVCDGFVTLMGLIQKMNMAGFKVSEAIDCVNENNLEKFPSEITLADEVYYKQQGWSIGYNHKYWCHVLKDKNHKIRKPLGFKSVEIADLVPEGFFGGTNV
jgi:hypothetical protein